jgi:prepilin-type N-terminal cleavage/methylation domain-containing protein
MKENCNTQIGVTLAEMLIVVAVLALCAVIAIPSADSVAPARADAAAGEVARALRFAQREAVRAHAWYQVKADKTTQTLRVYRLVVLPGIVTENTFQPTLHPVDKRKYDISFETGQGAMITDVSFTYDKGTSGANFVSFDPDGTPMEVKSDKNNENLDLKAGRITVSYGRQQRFINVSPVVGRVSISAN